MQDNATFTRLQMTLARGKQLVKEQRAKSKIYADKADEVADEINRIGPDAASGSYKGKAHENSYIWYRKHFAEMSEINAAAAIENEKANAELTDILKAYEEKQKAVDGLKNAIDLTQTAIDAALNHLKQVELAKQ